MPTASADRPLDPAALSDAARCALTDTLYRVQQQVFDGTDRDTFRKYVVDSDADRTRIQLYRDEAGDCVGYAAIHLFSVAVEGRKTSIMRSEVGILPTHRGQSLAWKFLAWEVARVVLDPRTTGFLVACPVHPASYYTMAKTNPYLHPRPGQPTAATSSILSQLDAALGLPRPDGGGEHVRSVGWVTRQSDAERSLWERHSSELVQFYLSENPGYERGEGLRIACPLSAASLAVGLGTMLGRLLRRQRAQARRTMTPASER